MLPALGVSIQTLWRIGDQVQQLGSLRLVGLEVGLWSILLLNMAVALAQLTPEIGKRDPLRHILLDQLPTSPFSLLAITWLQAIVYLVPIGGAYLAGVNHPDGARVGHWGLLIGFTLAFSLMGNAAGSAVVELVRVWVPTQQRRRAAWLSIAALGIALLGLVGSSFASHYAWMLRRDPMRILARALLVADWQVTLCTLLGVTAIAFGVIALCGRRVYDRIDSAPADASPRAAPALGRSADHAPVATTGATTQRAAPGSLGLDMAGVERLLFARESGVRALWIAGGIAAVIVVPVAGRALVHPIMVRLLVFLVTYLAFSLTVHFSAVMVRRDLDARPLLSALPITPYQTLEGKIQALRERIAPVLWFAALLALICLAVSAFNQWSRPVELIWRFAALCASIWLLCGAAVPVAFLTHGLGRPSLTWLAGSRSFATQLLGLPMFTVVATSNPLDALVPLGLLAAVGFEARRSAVRCVQWIDDPGDVPRDTPVWQALLVLSTFFCVQALMGQLLTMLGVSPGWVLASAYGGASFVLFLQLYQRRKGQPWPPVMPRRKASLVLGVCAGVLSALAGYELLALARASGWAPAAAARLDLHDISTWAATFAIVLMAPLAEETFFRGWLQPAIASQLAPARRWHAIVYGALAFAAVHFGSLYMPQLVLGLLAGALYARTGALLPGILAHAVNNGLVVLWESYFR